jgi:hypothetical protein
LPQFVTKQDTIKCRDVALFPTSEVQVVTLVVPVVGEEIFIHVQLQVLVQVMHEMKGQVSVHHKQLNRHVCGGTTPLFPDFTQEFMASLWTPAYYQPPLKGKNIFSHQLNMIATPEQVSMLWRKISYHC